MKQERKKALLDSIFFLTSYIAPNSADSKVLVQLTSEAGEKAGPPLELPLNVSAEQLQLLTNTLLSEVGLHQLFSSSYTYDVYAHPCSHNQTQLKKSSKSQTDDDDDDDENTPYAFFVNEEEIVDHLFNVIQNQKLETEAVVPVVYQPQVRGAGLVSLSVRLITYTFAHGLLCALISGRLQSPSHLSVQRYHSRYECILVRFESKYCSLYLFSFCPFSFPGHADNIVDAYFSPDGRCVSPRRLPPSLSWP